MAANVKIDIAAEFVGKKAFTDAAKQTVGLNAQVKTLAKSYLGLFTAQRLATSGVNAVKAFAEDDKAARSLGQTLNNLGLGFGNNAEAVNNYISGLEKQTGVLDDELRPAMDRLLRATGDITKSQELLNLALDIAAGTGKSVAQVSQSLQKAYLGQTQALGRLGVGLSKVELTSSNFEEIQARLSTLFSGQATQAANTYAGALGKLAVASNNAKEAIGQGLVDALAALGGGGEGGLENTLMLIEKTSTALATFIRRFGVGVGMAKALVTGDFKTFKALGEAEQNRGIDRSGITPAISAELKKAAAAKAMAKASAQQVKNTKEQTKAIKEQTALQKAGTLFDIQQTQIIAALKGDISAEERKRLELQLAILTGNTSEASKLAGELAKSQGLSQQLAAYLASLPDAKNPFTAWKSYLDMIEAQVRRIANPTVAPVVSMASGYGVTGAQYSLPMGATTTSAAGVDITVNVNAGSVIAEEGLKDVLRDSLLSDSLSAKFAAIYRQGGSFGS